MTQVLAIAAPLVKKFEGLRLTAYKCPADVWTIGYGHTGKDVVQGLKWTQAQADAALMDDMAVALCDVRKKVTRQLNDNQLAALVSFVFNLGGGAFGGSTLLKKINSGDIAGAGKEFGKWINAGGKPLPGLVKRRSAEAELWGKV